MLVVQSDLLDALPHVVVPPLSSELVAAPLYRIDMAPTSSNGLRTPSQVAVDRPFIVKPAALRSVIGRADDATLLLIGRALAPLLGLA